MVDRATALRQQADSTEGPDCAGRRAMDQGQWATIPRAEGEIGAVLPVEGAFEFTNPDHLDSNRRLVADQILQMANARLRRIESRRLLLEKALHRIRGWLR